jgi:hypothetical protein
MWDRISEYRYAWKLLSVALLASSFLLGCGDFEPSGDTQNNREGFPGTEGPAPVAVFMQPGTAIVRQGETLGFEAVAVYASGEKRTVTAKSTWSCTNPDVMEVSNDEESKGMATATGPGTSTMRVRTEHGLQAEAAIEVVPSAADLASDIRADLDVDLFPSMPTTFPLYTDVANVVRFQATNLGDSYTVELENIEGGAVGSAEESQRAFILSPSAAEMTFDVVVSNGERTERFDDLSYESRSAPRPRIQLMNARRGREVERGIDASDITSLTLNAIADSTFQANYSDDAAVRISSVKVTLDRQSGSPLVRSFSSGDIDLYDFRTAASEGDNLYIEILGVERLNYRDEVVEQRDYYPSSFYVPLK